MQDCVEWTSIPEEFVDTDGCCSPVVSVVFPSAVHYIKSCFQFSAIVRYANWVVKILLITQYNAVQLNIANYNVNNKYVLLSL